MRCRRLLLVGALIVAVCGAARAAAPAPVLQVAKAERISLLNAPAWRVYYDRYELTFTDPAGAPDLQEEIARATATTPDGKAWELEYDVKGRVSDTVSTITYLTPQSFAAPKEGQVTVEIVTHGGRRFTAKTPRLKRALGFLAPVSPPPDAILTERRPQFRWRGAAAPVTLEVMGESVSGPRAWEAKVTGGEIRYNADGEAQPDNLLPNRRYTWVVSATVKEEPVSYLQLMRVRLAVSAGRPSARPPALPGTLVWGNYYEAGFQDQNPCMMILQSPSSEPLSAFVGPVGLGYPDLSPDGRKLLYATNDGIWLDDLEGRPPRRLAAGFCRDPRWSRDMKHVAFVKSSKGRDPGGEDLDLDLWVCDADGSHLRAVANERGFHERFPSWSPDGKWIVYRREPYGDEGGQCLWVVRADGVGKHPVIATTVKGRPGYAVYHMGEQDWSPEGKRIATQFSVSSPSGEGFSGLGVVSPEGGVVTPLVMVPDSESHLIPSLPRWSPDGTQLVYTSGIPSEYPDADPEMREVWVVNADGTGKPVRVTYDHSKSNGFSWRAVAPEKVKARLARCGRAE